MALTSNAVLLKGFDGNAPVFYFKQFIEVDTLPTVGVKNVGYAVPTSATEFSYHYYDGSVWRGIAAGGAASVHNDLTGRDAAEQHPQSAITGLSTALGLKVDKVTGKGLSANDYTDTEKTKLSNIADGAEVNVNADWDSSSGDSEILNKPTIPTGGLVGTKEVDETDIADDKIIVYDSASGKYVLQVKPTGGGSSDVLQTLAYASTVVPNLALGNIITITLTGNIIIANPTGYTGIGKVEFIFIQGGTGGYTATFGTSYKQVVAPELNGNIGGKNYVEYYAYSETDIVLKNIVSL